MKYRKKPIVIDAYEIKASDFDNDHPNEDHIRGVVYHPVSRCVFVNTLEGTMRGEIGDYIIRGVRGELYPVRRDIFLDTYEAVEP